MAEGDSQEDLRTLMRGSDLPPFQIPGMAQDDRAPQPEEKPVQTAALPPFQIPGMGQSGDIGRMLQSVAPALMPQPGRASGSVRATPSIAGSGSGPYPGGIGGILQSLMGGRNVPEPPKPQYRDPLQTLANPLTALALIASAFTRRPATNAMGALAGAMKAQAEGDQIKYANDYQNYTQELQKVHTEAQQEAIDYKKDYENRKLSLQERLAGMRKTAVRRGDKAMLDILDAGADPGDLLDNRGKAGLPISAAMEKTAAIKKLMTDNKGMSYADAEAKYKADKAKREADAKAGTGKVGDPDLKGDAYLASLPPTTADTVRAVAEGRMPLPAGKWGAQIREMVAHYKPDFRGQTYGARGAAERNLSAGELRRNIRAVNTLIGHLDRMDSNIDALKNSDFPRANKAFKAWAQETGDPRYTRILDDIHAIAGELGRVFKGTVTEGEIKRNEAAIDAAGSPAQLHASVNEFLHLMESRLGSMEVEIQQTTGRTPQEAEDASLTPEAKRQREKLHGGDQGASSAPQGLPEGSKKAGFTPDGKEVWELPDGSKVTAQ